MQLVRNFYFIDKTNTLDKWTFYSKNLYNQALYIQKQHWKKEGKIYSFPEIDKIMKKEKNLEGEINYKLLPKAQTAQQILKLLDKNFKSFFKSIKEYQKHPNKFTGKLNPPKYINKKGKYLLIFTNQSAKIKNKEIYLNKNFKIKIPENVWINELQNFNQIRILPTKIKNKFKIEIIYTTQQKNINLNYNEYASIDLGVNNLITMITTLGEKPLIINGRIVKSINQRYNKKIAKLQSIKDKMKIKGYTKRMYKITEKRNRKIEDYFHKTTRYIINYLLSRGIGNLIIGRNKFWKQNVEMGKKNNQNFVQISYDRLIRMFLYKAEKVGIKVILREESYTSKCDALALEPLKHKKENEYWGKRKIRGLYQSSIGKLINADVNGALNILRKVVGDSFFRRIADSGFWFNPMKIRNIFDVQQDLATMFNLFTKQSC